MFLVWYRRVDMLRDKCLEGSLPAAVTAAATAAWFRFFDYLAARGGLRKPRWCLRLFASAGTVFGRALWEPGGCFVPRAVRCVFGKPVGCVGGGSPCCCGWNSCGLSVHRCAGSIGGIFTATASWEASTSHLNRLDRPILLIEDSDVYSKSAASGHQCMLADPSGGPKEGG